MIRRPPIATRTDTLFPFTTLFRTIPAFESEAAAASFRLSLLVGQQPAVLDPRLRGPGQLRSEEHTSELQSLMRISYAVFCLKKKIQTIMRQQTAEMT